MWNFRLVRRTTVGRAQSLAMTLGGLLLAFLAAGVLFFAVGVDPLVAYSAIIQSFTNPHLIPGTIERATPLLFASIGLGVAFRLGFWNIGAEGQLYMGAIASTGIVTIYLTQGIIPSFALLPIMFISSFSLGALYGMVPAILRAKLQVNEILSTLMMNYIAIQLGNYLIYVPWRDPEAHGFPNSRLFPPEALLPGLPGLGSISGIILASIIAFILYFIMNRTTLGFELRLTGDSPRAARYAGISYTKAVVIAMLISGGLAGLAGLAFVSGIIGRMKESFSGGAGYTAIIIAWLAGLNPVAAILASLLFGGLQVSGDTLQITLNLSASTVNIFQALILLFILVSEFMKRYRIVLGGAT